MRKGKEKLPRVSAFFLIFLILLSIVPVFTLPVFAYETKLNVKPPSIIDQTLTPPKTFKINVTLANVTNLYGFEFHLGYDTTILDIVKVEVKKFLNEPIYQAKNLTNEEEGWYWLAIASVSPALPKNGSGTLVTLTFKVTGIGRCLLDLYDTKLSDPKAKPIPHDVGDGYFNNQPPPKPALIFVDPPRIVNLTLVPCESFTINVSIINATYLYSFKFKLSFDPTMLNATSAVLGNIFPPGVTPTIEINNTVGYVRFSASLAPPQPGVSGNGTLATIAFHVEGLGACKLTLSETSLADLVGQPLPHTISHGYFNNILLAKLRVEPPEIIDPSLMPSATFEINVTLADVEGLYGYEFNLSFRTAILVCLSVTIHDVLNETNYTPQVIINNRIGFVWVQVAYYPPAEPITTYPPVALATIKFRVKATGETILDLNGVSLTDPLGQPILHEVYDGYVFILIRDVAVTNVVPSTTEAYKGWMVYINVTVKNEGNLTETFNVSAYYDNMLIGTLLVVNLAPNAKTNLIFGWDTKDVTPCYNYTIKAQATGILYETDTADNLYIDGKVKIKMLGDITGNGIVDIFDMVIAGAAFGSEPGHPDWDERADLNRDNTIDIFDLVTIGVNFGKKC